MNWWLHNRRKLNSRSILKYDHYSSWLSLNVCQKWKDYIYNRSWLCFYLLFFLRSRGVAVCLRMMIRLFHVKLGGMFHGYRHYYLPFWGSVYSTLLLCVLKHNAILLIWTCVIYFWSMISCSYQFRLAKYFQLNLHFQISLVSPEILLH